HDALPIYPGTSAGRRCGSDPSRRPRSRRPPGRAARRAPASCPGTAGAACPRPLGARRTRGARRSSDFLQCSAGCVADCGGDGAGDERAGDVTRLAKPAEGSGFVRTPTPYPQLPAAERHMADHLVARRLLVHDRAPDGTHVVEFAHQALIDHWPRLREWLAADREFLVWLHETERQASDWHRSGRDSGELLRGRALSHAQQWVADREESVPPLVREFVAAGAARNRRDRRIRRGVVAALSVVVIAAV